MYVNLNSIVGFQVQSTDGPAGTIDDVFVDDILWKVRHVAVADAGGVGTQPASIDPDSYGELNPKKKTLGVKLTHAEIGGGPDVSSDPPVSLQTDEHGDPHLRSAQEIHGYKINALDGEAGEIDDFIVDDEQWKIHFIVVETGDWNDHRKIVIAPGCCPVWTTMRNPRNWTWNWQKSPIARPTTRPSRSRTKKTSTSKGTPTSEHPRRPFRSASMHSAKAR